MDSRPGPSQRVGRTLYLQQADGSLATPYRLDGGNGQSVAIGDVNGDGLAEIDQTCGIDFSIRFDQALRDAQLADLPRA